MVEKKTIKRMMPKISGIMINRNSEKTIKKAVLSVKDIIDELIIIDDNSTDKSLEVVKKLYPKAIIKTRALNGDFASQRNYALSLAKNNWVVMIDTDEALSPALRKEILTVLRNPQFKAYTSRRDNLVFNKFYPATSGRPILHRSSLKFKYKLHEQIEGIKFGYLKQPLLHYNWQGVEDMIKQINRYSTLEALKWYREKRKYNLFHLFLIALLMPFYSFFLHFFYYKKYRSGLIGFIYSMGNSIIWIFKVLKFYEFKYIMKKVNEKELMMSK